MLDDEREDPGNNGTDSDEQDNDPKPEGPPNEEIKEDRIILPSESDSD